MRNFLSIAARVARAGAATLVLPAATGLSGYASPSITAVAATHGPSLRVDAPAQVDVGEPITIELTAQNVADIAGYELNLLFDTSVAEFDGLRQRTNDLKKIGRDVGPLGAVEMPNGIAIGMYSCPTSNCVDGKGPKQPAGGHGTVKLATVVLIAQHPGALEINLDTPKFRCGGWFGDNTRPHRSPAATSISTLSLRMQFTTTGTRAATGVVLTLIR